MKILLFNDNPVVRKLVALSAQKTKDDLSVIWSVDEVEESGYDLLIVDDALYSDEMFSSLKELVTFKSTLLMATRGKAIPAGFDNVINKPFLPTDLVDMFIQIEKKFSDNPTIPEVVFAETPIEEEKPAYAINLEETLPDLGPEDLNTFESFDLEGLDDLTEGLEMDEDLDLDNFEDAIPETAILDKEEVQEVQGLLDDTENDDWDLEDEIELSGIDEAEEVDLSKDDDIEISNPISSSASPAETLGDEFDFDDELISGFEEEDTDSEATLPEMDAEDLLLGDEELGALESEIQNAVNTLEADTLDQELEPEDFDMQLDDSFLEELKLPDMEDDNSFSGVDDLDMLDERELKLAIGEEVEDEPEPDVEVDLLKEEEEIAEEEDADTLIVEPAVEMGHEVTHAEGVEALQALLKALSNEDVAKSLKGLNISININFGNQQ
ncbi:MAG: hypothetical protein PHI47_02245 [Sulfuricurvum sp.]|uniref:hypothetical protein n=1 Tax=Sulfuricurvum sp. TaxID=2025608 RepID=UPI00260C1D82|nr:hypothetical protein [Sulfuricurvum sp.]MDD5158846.1 hypothetical protein [Sulfuricurvum sp.]